MEFEKYQCNTSKKILLTGGTGFIGKRLVDVLVDFHHEITISSSVAKPYRW